MALNFIGDNFPFKGLQADDVVRRLCCFRFRRQVSQYKGRNEKRTAVFKDKGDSERNIPAGIDVILSSCYRKDRGIQKGEQAFNHQNAAENEKGNPYPHKGNEETCKKQENAQPDSLAADFQERELLSPDSADSR
jgi:hypothetical protein